MYTSGAVSENTSSCVDSCPNTLSNVNEETLPPTHKDNSVSEGQRVIDFFPASFS
jgi:hypothetical protein